MKKKFTLLIVGMALIGAIVAFAVWIKKNSEKTEEPVNEVKEVIESVEVETADEEEEFHFAPANVVCSLPEGFIETETGGEYLHETYPADVSSINQVIQESEADSTLMTAEEFETTIENEYKSAYGDDVDINISQFDKIVVDKRPGLWIMYDFIFRGDEYRALMVILYNGTESNYITYLQGPGSDWMDAFVASAKSIKFVDL